MTAEKDPRIEAVGKLLFTGPLRQHNADKWDVDRSDFNYDRAMCLMAAEDVLRGIDEAAEVEKVEQYRKRAVVPEVTMSVDEYYQRYVRGQKAPE